MSGSGVSVNLFDEDDDLGMHYDQRVAELLDDMEYKGSGGAGPATLANIPQEETEDLLYKGESDGNKFIDLLAGDREHSGSQGSYTLAPDDDPYLNSLATTSPAPRFGVQAGQSQPPVSQAYMRVKKGTIPFAQAARKLTEYQIKLPNHYEAQSFFADKEIRSLFRTIIERTEYRNDKLFPWFNLLSFLFGGIPIPSTVGTFNTFVSTIKSRMDVFVLNGLDVGEEIEVKSLAHPGLAFLQSISDGEVVNRLMHSAGHLQAKTASGESCQPLASCISQGHDTGHHPMYSEFLRVGSDRSVLGNYYFPRGSSPETIAAIYCETFKIR